jgi:pimeloyl-ACP methyl ester carboxylesterase
MMAVSAEVRERSVDVWNGTVKLRFKIAGSAGAPLIYFHPAGGLFFDPFLSALAADYTVYAPEHPGTSAGDPDAIHHVDSIWDLILLYEEAIRQLDLQSAPVAIGQSFGGMIAAELAAHFPSLFKGLILFDPLGLWREELPIANWMTTPPTALPALLFKDPRHPAAKAMFTPPNDPETALSATAHMIWTFGCTGKFVWPIPERGLRKRLHRVSVPDTRRVGRGRRACPSRVRRGIRQGDHEKPHRDYSRLRTHSPSRAKRHYNAACAGFPPVVRHRPRPARAGAIGPAHIPAKLPFAAARGFALVATSQQLRVTRPISLAKGHTNNERT